MESMGSHRWKKGGKRAYTGIEPVTSRTLSENHTTRPAGHTIIPRNDKMKVWRSNLNQNNVSLHLMHSYCTARTFCEFRQTNSFHIDIPYWYEINNERHNHGGGAEIASAKVSQKNCWPPGIEHLFRRKQRATCPIRIFLSTLLSEIPVSDKSKKGVNIQVLVSLVFCFSSLTRDSSRSMIWLLAWSLELEWLTLARIRLNFKSGILYSAINLIVNS